MADRVIEKEYRVRGRISSKGEYWTQDRKNAGSKFGKGTSFTLPNDIGFLDFKIQVIRYPKVFKDEWSVLFAPDSDIEPDPKGHPVYNTMGLGYDKKKTETELDLANKFLDFINSRQQLTKWGGYFSPIALNTGADFAKYWLGETVDYSGYDNEIRYEPIVPETTSSGTASVSGPLPFFEILGEYTPTVPPVTDGYFSKWDEFVKKLLNRKEIPNNKPMIGATAPNTGKLIKDFKFNVETENVFKLVGGTGSSFDTLTILSKTQSIAETQTANDYTYNDSSEELDEEFSEEIFAGDAELKEVFEIYIEQISQNTNSNITPEEKTEIAKEMIKYKPGKPSKSPPADVIKAMKDYGIVSALERAHFLAQCAHESGQFAWKREFASGKAYEGRKDLGNTQTGDGVRYKGRGYIQITGRANYTAYNNYLKSKGINDDVVANPELLEGKFAADCSVWFWSIAGPKNSKNFPKKANEGSGMDIVTKISRWVNGGDNGLEDRKEKFTYYWSELEKNPSSYT
jgi:putative chitinase